MIKKLLFLASSILSLYLCVCAAEREVLFQEHSHSFIQEAAQKAQFFTKHRSAERARALQKVEEGLQRKNMHLGGDSVRRLAINEVADVHSKDPKINLRLDQPEAPLSTTNDVQSSYKKVWENWLQGADLLQAYPQFGGVSVLDYALKQNDTALLELVVAAAGRQGKSTLQKVKQIIGKHFAAKL